MHLAKAIALLTAYAALATAAKKADQKKSGKEQLASNNNDSDAGFMAMMGEVAMPSELPTPSSSMDLGTTYSAGTGTVASVLYTDIPPLPAANVVARLKAVPLSGGNVLSDPTPPAGGSKAKAAPVPAGKIAAAKLTAPTPAPAKKKQAAGTPIMANARMAKDQIANPPLAEGPLDNAVPLQKAHKPMKGSKNQLPAAAHSPAVKKMPVAAPAAPIQLPQGNTGQSSSTMNPVQKPACPGHEAELWRSPNGGSYYWTYLNRNWPGWDIPFNVDSPQMGGPLPRSSDARGCAERCDRYNAALTDGNGVQCVGVSWAWQNATCILKSRMMDIYYPAAPYGEWETETQFNCHTNAASPDQEWVSMVSALYRQDRLPMSGGSLVFQPSGLMADTIIARCPLFDPNPYNSTVTLSSKGTSNVTAMIPWLLYSGVDWPDGTVADSAMTAKSPISAQTVQECIDTATFLNTNTMFGDQQPLITEVTWAGSQATSAGGFNCYLRSAVNASYANFAQGKNYDCRTDPIPWGLTPIVSAILASDHIDVHMPFAAMSKEMNQKI